ncbi:MAG: hypothetical protein ACI4L7_02455 [Christensenellales bacterium]
MSKKKYMIAIVSLSLIIVALVGAVIGIWAATQQTVNSKLYVSYTPSKDVIAKVNASYSINGATSATAIGSQQSFTYGSSGTTAALDKTNLTLTDSAPYIIFAFSFQNSATSSNTYSKYLNIAETSNPAVSNMTVSKKYSTTAMTTPMNKTNFTSLTDGSNTVLKNIQYGNTVYIYVMVEITTKGVPAYWGSTSANSFSFVLTASNATS